MNDLIRQRLLESIQVKQAILEDDRLCSQLSLLAEEMILCFRRGGKILLCGNGGSYCDALHFSGELLGNFQKERPALPAIVLGENPAAATAIANDCGSNSVFARQAAAFLAPGDLLLAISTSGNSENVCQALLTAREKGCRTAALLGRDGGKMRCLSDLSLLVPGSCTARIQECHITLLHILCELVEEGLCHGK